MDIKRYVRTVRRLPSALWLAVAGVAFAVIVVGGVELTSSGPQPAGDTLQSNPYLDPGTHLTGPAPDFTLTDQFGARVSLRSFRGKVVILAFNDSECTTICPLTTTAMVDARRCSARPGRACSCWVSMRTPPLPGSPTCAPTRSCTAWFIGGTS